MAPIFPQLPTVLVVEDEPVVRMLASDMAEEAGFRVLEAATAESALKMIEEHDEVIILFTDVNMPGALDGFELAEMVHQRWPHVGLIITSGRLRPFPTDIPDAGIFIAKPYSEASLVGALNEMKRRAT